MKNKKLDETKLKMMLLKIIGEERRNIVRKDKTKEEMANTIRKIIETEVEKNDN